MMVCNKEMCRKIMTSSREKECVSRLKEEDESEGDNWIGLND